MEYNFSDKINPVKPSAIREIFKVLQDKSVISFAGGNPAEESFPIEDIKRLSAELLEKSAGQALQYSQTEGYPFLREQVKARLKEKFSIGSEQDELIITSGGQQAIDLTAKILCNEGDTVICENPSFIGALNAFRAYNLNLVGVDLENDGMNIAQLENTLKTAKNVRFIYVIPTFQNPMGITTSLEKRRAIMELAKRYNVLILEDNPYADIRFSGHDLPTLKSMDTEGRVIYAGTFSKIFSAGMRVGFCLAPKEVIAKIVVAKQVNDVHTNIFFQMLLSNYLSSCDLDSHILTIRALYAKKSSAMLEAISKYLPDDIEVTHPEGGLFLWVTPREGTDIDALVKELAARKVAVVTGKAFQIDENSPAKSFRLNYSMPTLEKIEEGIKIIGEVMNG